MAWCFKPFFLIRIEYPGNLYSSLKKNKFYYE